MPIINELRTETAARFFAVIEESYPSSLRPYQCPVLGDLDYAVLGTLRCLSEAKTGQEFLQLHAEKGGRDENADLFFKALKSKRRLKNLTSLTEALAPVMKQKINDPLQSHPELKGYHFFAADGHYQAAACFDTAQPTRKGELRKEATGHFFRVDLRSHHMSYLDLSRPGDGKKRDHDARVIQRLPVEALRFQAIKGEKVVYFWDKACVDYHTWSRLKRNGIYFVTREKSNSAMKAMSGNQTNYDDARNEGIISDTLVGNSNGEALRRIIYQDPRDGKIYTYLTNEMQLPPWAIALGYKHRWDIEKIFDQFKNKMAETKSWASSKTAKESHAQFECLAHNLTLLLEEEIINEEGLRDTLEEKKRVARRKNQRNREGERLNKADDFISRGLQRASQRTVRFLRWLRVWLYHQAPWSEALARLAKVWSC